MCSGCINDRDSLVGKVLAELSTLARLEVTPVQSPRCQAEDTWPGCAKIFIASPPKTQLLHHSREKQEGVGQRLVWQ